MIKGLFVDIEEIFAFQLAVFHATSGIHRGSLNLDVQNGCRKFLKVIVASHLWNSPTMATDAFTSNFIVLSIFVISKTGACAGLTGGNATKLKEAKNSQPHGILA